MVVSVGACKARVRNSPVAPITPKVEEILFEWVTYSASSISPAMDHSLHEETKDARTSRKSQAIFEETLLPCNFARKAMHCRNKNSREWNNH